MVHSDTDGSMMLAADVEEGDEALLNLLQLSLILLIGIFQMLEGASRVDVVSWVDAHLLYIACCHIGHIGVEVDVGHKRCHVALQAQFTADVL